MKKLVSLFMSITILFSLTACGEVLETENVTDITSAEAQTDEQGEIDQSFETTAPIISIYTLDFNDSASFETALNNKDNVVNKTVYFKVKDYQPDSAFGYNSLAGEHLNFISENDIDVAEGNIVVGRILKKPYKFLGAWIISYEVLEVSEDGENIVTQTVSSVTTSTTLFTTQKTTTTSTKKTTTTTTTTKKKTTTTTTTKRKTTTSKAPTTTTKRTTTADTRDIMVWIPTNGGKKYHSNPSCSQMKNPDYVTIGEAKALGFTPCGRCY